MSGNHLSTEAIDAFDTVSREMLLDAAFFTLSEEAAKAIQLVSGIYVFKAGDVAAKFEGNPTDLRRWCEQEKWLPFIEMDSDIMTMYADSLDPKPLVLALTTETQPEKSQILHDALRQLSASKTYYNYQFAWMDGNKMTRLLYTGMGVELGDLPKVIVGGVGITNFSRHLYLLLAGDHSFTLV